MFGGCVSCPQFFMLPGAADCCKAGKCDRSKDAPVKRDCKRMPMACSAKQQVHIDVALFTAAPAIVEADVRAPAHAPLAPADDIERPPPDRSLLNCTFLV